MPTGDTAHAVMRGAFGANRGRTAVATLAIALGVALGFAIQTVNRTALAEFTSGMATLSGTADLVVRGPSDGFDESVYAAISAIDAVAIASPVVDVEARLPGRDDTLRVVGVDAFRAAAVTPAIVGRADDALDLLRGDRIFLSPAAQEWLGERVGGRIDIPTGNGVAAFTVAGTLPASGGQRIAGIDIAAAQDAFGRAGRLSRIDLRLVPGANAEAARAAIAAHLPPGVTVEHPGDGARLAERMTRAYRVNLDVLSLVALFTGSLLVFSTQTLSIVRRRTQLALLRTLGLPRRVLVALLVTEGALVGAIGAAFGLVAGYALAHMLLRIFGADLGAGFFRGEAPSLAVSTGDALLVGALGIVAALAGAWLPAREAARASPAAAIRAGDGDTPFARLGSPWPGTTCLVVSLFVVALPPVGRLPLFGYAAIALMLVGTLLLLPRIARALLARVPTPARPAGALALASLRAAPGQAIVSLAAIVAAVALAVSMAIMVASFRQSLSDWLERMLPADLYLRAGGTTGTDWLDPDDQRALAALPGVRRVEFLRATRIVVRADEPPVTLLARDVHGGPLAQRLPLVTDAVTVADPAAPAAWVSEAFADRYGASPGKRIDLPIAGRLAPFTVAGVWRDYARQNGAVIVARDDYRRLAGAARGGAAAGWLGGGAAPPPTTAGSPATTASATPRCGSNRGPRPRPCVPRSTRVSTATASPSTPPAACARHRSPCSTARSR